MSKRCDARHSALALVAVSNVRWRYSALALVAVSNMYGARYGALAPPVGLDSFLEDSSLALAPPAFEPALPEEPPEELDSLDFSELPSDFSPEPSLVLVDSSLPLVAVLVVVDGDVEVV